MLRADSALLTATSVGFLAFFWAIATWNKSAFGPIYLALLTWLLRWEGDFFRVNAKMLEWKSPPFCPLQHYNADPRNGGSLRWQADLNVLDCKKIRRKEKYALIFLTHPLHYCSSIITEKNLADFFAFEIFSVRFIVALFSGCFLLMSEAWWHKWYIDKSTAICDLKSGHAC